MVLKATLQKESPNQSFPKVSSEAAVRRCSSKLVFYKFPKIYRKTSVLESLFNKGAGLTTSTHVFLWILRNLLNAAKFFKPPVASADLLFLIKSNVGCFQLKRVDLVIVRVIYTFLVDTTPTRFYWLTSRNE